MPKAFSYSQRYENYLLFPTFPTAVEMGGFAVLFISHVKVDAYGIDTGYENNMVPLHEVEFFVERQYHLNGFAFNMQLRNFKNLIWELLRQRYTSTDCKSALSGLKKVRPDVSYKGYLK